jgi:hypothetical protein
VAASFLTAIDFSREAAMPVTSIVPRVCDGLSASWTAWACAAPAIACRARQTAVTIGLGTVLHRSSSSLLSLNGQVLSFDVHVLELQVAVQDNRVRPCTGLQSSAVREAQVVRGMRGHAHRCLVEREPERVHEVA